MFSPHDRSATPHSTFDGRGGAARPLRPAKLPGSDAFASGQTAREIRPMNLTTFNLPAEFTTANVRPATRRPNHLEHATMLPMHPDLQQTAVTMRMQDMRVEAARRRTLRELRAARPAVHPLTTLRRAVGTMLVRAGERVQGAERATARPATGSGDLTVAGTHLRLVR